MSAAALTPRIRLMAVCDGVRESKTEADVFHLRGVRYEISADGFPFVAASLWLFMFLSSPRRGEFPGYVRIVNDRTDKASFYAKLTPEPTFDGDREMRPARVRLRCKFPEAGRYTVQVWFFQDRGTDVLKGEMPLSVVLQED